MGTATYSVTNMIITNAKPLSEVLSTLAECKSVFIVGCAACATKCQTGGDSAVKQMAVDLQQAGKHVAGSIILDTPCDIRIVKRDLTRLTEANSADALVIMACGAGVQSISAAMEKKLVPTLNPVFVGSTERIGIYNEYCSMCGNCMLARTGGICPVTRCSKSLVNGPCGGEINGKCEVDAEKDCAWVLIYRRLKALGKDPAVLAEYIPPKNFAKPGKIDRSKR
jgi:ferredoxin